jgi:hypothetical protein
MVSTASILPPTLPQVVILLNRKYLLTPSILMIFSSSICYLAFRHELDFGDRYDILLHFDNEIVFERNKFMNCVRRTLTTITVMLAVVISGCSSDRGTGEKQDSDKSNVTRGEQEMRKAKNQALNLT